MTGINTRAFGTDTSESFQFCLRQRQKQEAMAEQEFIEVEGEFEYETDEVSSESGSEYGYDSDTIEDLVSKMSEEDQQEWKTLKHYHTRQLFEKKQIIPIHHEASEALDEARPRIPREKLAEVLDEAKATTSTAAVASTSATASTSHVPKARPGKAIVTKVKARDDEFLRRYLNPRIKTEEEEQAFPSVPDVEILDSDEDESEEEEVIRDAKSNIIHALEELEDLTSKQVKVYSKLRQNLQLLDAGDTLSFQQVAEQLPGPSTTLAPDLINYLQSLEPRDRRKVVGVGHLLFARVQASKAGEKAPLVEDIANKYKISTRELYEVKRGEAYLGGKQRTKREATSVETTPKKKAKVKTEPETPAAETTDP